MKKFLLLIVCLLTVVGLSGCSIKVLGTWELSEITTKVLGFEKTYKIGEEYEGEILTSESTYITFNIDGTGKMALLGSEPSEITWEMQDDDIIIKGANDLTIEAELDDGFLEFDMSVLGTGVEFKLSKNGLF